MESFEFWVYLLPEIMDSVLTPFTWSKNPWNIVVRVIKSTRSSAYPRYILSSLITGKCYCSLIVFVQCDRILNGVLIVKSVTFSLITLIGDQQMFDF